MTEARLPNDLHLEHDVISSCLLKPESVLTVGVGEEDFAAEAHRLVWRAMSALVEAGEAVDLVHVRTKLIDWDSLDAVGGEAFLGTLRRTVPSKSLPVDRLHRMRRLRALRAQAEAVAAAAAGNDPDMASAALEATLALSADEVARRPKGVKQLAEEWYESLQRDPTEGSVSPGLPALKRVIGRLDCGSMTLIGADVNVGKSSMALEMLLLALHDGERVGYLSMEDPEKVVTERIMSVLGGISAKRVRRFKPGDACERQVDRALEAMHAVNDRMLVANCVGMNEREVLEQMTMMAKSGCKLIVLDYIGVVGCSVRQQDRRNEIRWIATRFKARAVHTKTAIVVVSQFQRPRTDTEGPRRPTKHSFKEAGDLEAMAEYAVVMWRKVEDDFAPVYCELAKSKTGGVGYGWTMQRETVSTRLDEHGRPLPGSGRLVEVKHDDEYVTDEDGHEVFVRPVMRDATGANRWTMEKTAR
jgi:replicative DNA helicase